MTSKTNDSSSQVPSQGENASNSGPLAGPPEHQTSRSRNQVFKSGPLFISSKGIGWTSWKKRWFILTRTSLVFFRSDPSAAPQKGGEVNLTLGGIDLNNSASVEVKADKKLLTVFFPDGRDGRAFTLKAETLEDLHEWKAALENALAQAPSATHPTGQNGVLKSEQADTANGSPADQQDRPPIKSMVIGRPILLALEDIDGSPSFLEKALRYIEDHGKGIEGILRQAADVDDVHRRVREYEQGKIEFTTDEDAHVIGDCIKYILRELPSSPVPASCCNALLEAFRADRNNRLNAMRTAILETFPEPNRRLLQRILLMMQTVASNKTVNRMSTSAVAACMSPLLLRPLLAGDCELENTHMDVAGDGSFQLLQAAAAANHAQAIIITLLEEYDNIFGEGSMSAALFSDSDESGTGTEEATDDDDMYEDDDDECYEDDDHEYASDDHDADDHDDDDHDDDDHDEETDDDYGHSVTGTCSESGDNVESDSKHSRSSSFSRSPERANNHLEKQRSPSASPRSSVPEKNSEPRVDDSRDIDDRTLAKVDDSSSKSCRDIPADTRSANESASSPSFSSQTPATKFLGSSSHVMRPRWGRTSAKKNLSMESIDFSLEDEDDEIQRLEAAKIELQNRVAEEANGNAILQASLERRKKALHERRLALENDVARLVEQLQKEKKLRATLESGSKVSTDSSSDVISEKEIAVAEENLNNLKQRFDEIGSQLRLQREQNASLMHDRNNMVQDTSSEGTPSIYNKDIEMKEASHPAENSSKNAGNYNMDGADRDIEWKSESSFSNKNQNQSNDTSRGGHPKFGWLPNSLSPAESPAPKSSSSTSRKSSSKGEGGSSTTSALSKLTNRLNFLKERRNQIASELQNIDKGKGSSNQPALSPGKGKAPELHIIHYTEKNQGPGSGVVQNQDNRAHQDSNKKSDHKDTNKKSASSKSDAPSSKLKAITIEEDSYDSGRKSDNRDGNRKGSGSKYEVPPSQNLDHGRKSENQSNQQLDRVKSEGQASRNSDKGRQQDVQHSSTSRTLSR